MPDPFSFDTRMLPLAAQQEIDAVCIEFENAWKSGDRPCIEAFVTRLSEPLRAPLLRKLLLVELDYRWRRGDTPSAEQYRTRFPDLESVVIAVFEQAAPAFSAGSTPFDQLAQDTPSRTIAFTAGNSGGGFGPGQSLGRFELRERLGAGGFGTVYRAYDTMLRREVALKLPHPGRFESDEARARTLREAQAAAQLYHPHIVPVYDAGSEGETFFIASAFVEGETLARSMDERRPDFHGAATIVVKLATALDYAHRRGIIHRDVKPGNVMVASRASGSGGWRPRAFGAPASIRHSACRPSRSRCSRCLRSHCVRTDGTSPWLRVPGASRYGTRLAARRFTRSKPTPR